jgi:hypothetical protein
MEMGMGMEMEMAIRAVGSDGKMNRMICSGLAFGLGWWYVLAVRKSEAFVLGLIDVFRPY